ncbi:MAG: hypothetical protein ACYTGL_00880 [Planctomycetota bacterium]
MKHLRKDVNACLARIGLELQLQSYDHVLREDELERGALESVSEYIARNTERAGIIGVDQFATYPFTGCMIPGYPLLRLFEPDSWERLWRTLAFLRRTECFRDSDPRRSEAA